MHGVVWGIGGMEISERSRERGRDISNSSQTHRCPQTLRERENRRAEEREKERENGGEPATPQFFFFP